jgi:hypothetical protein
VDVWVEVREIDGAPALLRGRVRAADDDTTAQAIAGPTQLGEAIVRGMRDTGVDAEWGAP